MTRPGEHTFDFRDPCDDRPTVHVVVGFGNAERALTCIVDSGSTHTVFGSAIAEALELVPAAAGLEPIVLRSGGGPVNGLLAPVTLEFAPIGDEEPIKLEVEAVFLDRQSAPRAGELGLLGVRGFFDRFVVTIEQPRRRLILRTAGEPCP